MSIGTANIGNRQSKQIRDNYSLREKMALAENRIICGDCLEVLPKLPKAKMIFADPPDNLGMKYSGFVDCNEYYAAWLTMLINTGRAHGKIFWLSYYHKYQMHYSNQNLLFEA